MPFYAETNLFVELDMEVPRVEPSIKIRRMVGARRPADAQRLMVWYEDALDLENACRDWEKAAELLRSKIRKTADNRLSPAA